MYITIIIALLIAAAFVVAKRTSNDDILTVAVVVGIVLAVILPISVATLIVSYRESVQDYGKLLAYRDVRACKCNNVSCKYEWCEIARDICTGYP